MKNEPTSDLPKPKKKPNPEKEKFLEFLRNYKPKKEVIYQEELELAKETVAKFKCPLNFNPLYCEGYVCPDIPTKEDECLQYRKALILIDKVNKGKIKVRYRTMAVEMP